MKNGGLEALFSNLPRLDSQENEEAHAIYNTLSIFEIFVELKIELCDEIASKIDLVVGQNSPIELYIVASCWLFLFNVQMNFKITRN